MFKPDHISWGLWYAVATALRGPDNGSRDAKALKWLLPARVRHYVFSGRDVRVWGAAVREEPITPEGIAHALAAARGLREAEWACHFLWHCDEGTEALARVYDRGSTRALHRVARTLLDIHSCTEACEADVLMGVLEQALLELRDAEIAELEASNG